MVLDLKKYYIQGKKFQNGIHSHYITLYYTGKDVIDEYEKNQEAYGYNSLEECENVIKVNNLLSKFKEKNSECVYIYHDSKNIKEWKL